MIQNDTFGCAIILLSKDVKNLHNTQMKGKQAEMPSFLFWWKKWQKTLREASTHPRDGRSAEKAILTTE